MTMTISEALSRVAKLVLTKGESFEDAQAWDVIRSRLEVTDDVVERAAKRHMEVRGLGMLSPWETCSEETRHFYRCSMKAALVAALGDEHDAA